MKKYTEDDFSKEVVNFFREKLSQSKWEGLVTVEEKVKILKDFTIGKDRAGQLRLLAGFQQQDIVFSCPAQAIPMAAFKSKVMRIDKYDRTGQTPVTVPLLICELKVGKGVTTHAVIVYSSIAAQLKNIFPHCAYYFVMKSNEWRGMQPETVLRHSKGFDRVYLNWVREMEAVWQDIESHFNYLSQIGVIEWPDK